MKFKKSILVAVFLVICISAADAQNGQNGSSSQQGGSSSQQGGSSSQQGGSSKKKKKPAVKQGVRYKTGAQLPAQVPK